jgi:hypothetical protein
MYFNILLIFVVRHLPSCRSASLKVVLMKIPERKSNMRDYNSIFDPGDDVVALCVSVLRRSVRCRPTLYIPFGR